MRQLQVFKCKHLHFLFLYDYYILSYINYEIEIVLRCYMWRENEYITDDFDTMNDGQNSLYKKYMYKDKLLILQFLLIYFVQIWPHIRCAS